MSDSNLLNFTAGLDTGGFDKGIEHILDSVGNLAEKVNRQAQDVRLSLENAATAATNAADVTGALARTKGVNIDVKMDASKFIEQNNILLASVRESLDTLNRYGDNLTSLIGRFSNFTGFTLLGIGLDSFAAHVRDVRSSYQQIEIAFNTMLGSADKTAALMKQLSDTALITPFEMPQVVEGAKQLLSYGTSVDVVNEKLVQLGDIAAGMGKPLNDLVFLYGTTMTQGRMYTQDLRQFQGRGIPIADEIAKHFGVAKEKVGSLVTQGKVTAEVFDEVLLGMAKNGGQFEGMMENQSKSFQGRLSNIQDGIDNMFNEIGKSSEGLIGGMIDVTGTIVDHWKEVGKAILTVIAAFSAFKLGDWVQLKEVNVNLDETIEKLNELNRSASDIELDKDLDMLVKRNKVSADWALEMQEKRNEVEEKGGKDKSVKELREEADRRVLVGRESLSAFKEENKELDDIIKNDDDSEVKRGKKKARWDDDLQSLHDSGSLDDEELDKMQQKRDIVADIISRRQQEVALLDERKGIIDADLANAESQRDFAEEYQKITQDTLDAVKEKLAIESEKQGIDEDSEDYAELAESLGLFNAEKENEAAINEVAATTKEADRLAQEADYIATERGTLVNEIGNAQQQLNNATNRTAIAIENAHTTAVNMGTAANKRFSVSAMLSATRSKMASAAKAVWTSVTKSLTNAVKGLWQTLKANPLGFIISAVTTLIGLLWTVSDEEENVSEECERFGESAVKTRNNVKLLYDVLGSVSKNSKVFKDSLAELKKIASEYNITLSKERDEYEQLLEIREKMIGLIEEEGRARQLANKMQELEGNKMESRKTFLEAAAKNIEGQSKSDDVKSIKSILASNLADAVEADKEYVETMIKKIEEAREHTKSYSDSQFIESLENLRKYEAELAQRLNATNRELLARRGLNVGSDFKLDFKDLYAAVKDYQDVLGTIADENERIKKEYEDNERRLAKLKEGTIQAFDYTQQTGEKIQERLNRLRDGAVAVGETVISPPVNTVDIDNLIKESQEAKDKLDEVNDKDTKAKVDSSEVEDAKEESETLLGLLKSIYGLTTTPYIDTKYLDIANAALDEMYTKLVEKIPEAMRGYFFTMNELETITNGKGESLGTFSQFFPEEDRDFITTHGWDAYNAYKAAQNRSTVIVGGQEFKVADSNAAAALQHIRDKHGKTTFTQEEMAQLPAEDRNLLKQIQTDAVKSGNKDDDVVETHDEAVAKAVAGFQSRIKDAKSNKDYSEIEKDINDALSIAARGSKEYQEYKKLLKQIKRIKDDDEDAPAREYQRRKAREKEEKRRRELELKLEREHQQHLIDLMQEGREKQIAQIRLDEQKKRDALVKEVETEAEKLEQFEMQQWLALDKERKEYMWENSSARKSKEEYTAMAEAALHASDRELAMTEDTSKKLQKILKDDAKAMNEFIKEYGDYYQRRAAIVKYYNEEIRKAQSVGERLQKEAEMRKTLKDLDSEKMKKDLNWEMVFGDISRLSTDTLVKLKSQLRNVLKDTKNPDDAKAIVEQMDKIDEAIIATEREWKDLCGLSFRFIEERNSRQLKYNQALEEQNRLTEQHNANLLNRDIARENLVGTLEQMGVRNAQGQVYSINDLDGFDSTKADEVVSSVRASAYSQTDDAKRDEMLKQADELEKMFGDLAKAEQDVTASSEDLANANKRVEISEEKMKTTLTDVFNAINEVMAKLGPNLQSLKDAAVSIFGDDSGVSSVIGGAVDGINQGMDAFKDFSSGNYVGAALNATKAIESFGTALGIFGSSDKSLARDMERLTNANVALKNAISSLTEKMSEMSMSESIEAYKQMKDDIDTAMRNTAELMRRNAAEYARGIFNGKHSSNVKIDKEMSASDWDKVSKAAGTSVKSASAFWQLTSEQMAMVADNAPNLYAKIKQYADDGKGDAAQFMDEYISYYKQVEEIENAMRQKMTSTTFDSVRDSFKTFLSDASKSAAEFANDFNNMLIDSIAEALMADKYNDSIKALYKHWAELADGGLTDGEMDTLAAERDAIMAAMEKDRKDLEFLRQKSQQQNGTSGGFQSMGQDTANELNGRFTALQMSGVQIAQCAESINADTNEIRAASLEMARGITDMLMYNFLQLEELRSINANTVPIAEVAGYLEKIEKKIRNL